MRVRGVAVLLSLFVPTMLWGQASYTTGFENPPFTLGDVNGQNGWGHLPNSPTDGFIEATPAGTPALLGTQALAIRTRATANFGVANNLFSPTIDPAGETGSTAVVVVPNPKSRFQASLWYRTPDVPPISISSDGRFAELDPSSKGSGPADGANRYVVLRLLNTTNTPLGIPRAILRWAIPTGSGFTGATVADLSWATWYRIEYTVDLVDGLNGAEPNDRVKITIYAANGSVLGSACGSTWEVGYKDASFGFGGGLTPRAINGFDFWSLATPNTTLVGHIDQFSMSTSNSPAALQASIGGNAKACAGGTTTLTAGTVGGSGTIVSYAWRNASNTVVGTSATLVAGAGSYSVTATDSDCLTATSAPFVVSEYAPLAASISGNTNVCFGGTTTLTANSAGGSGSVTGYTWRDGSSNVVGTGASVVVPAGTYTVTATDATCGTAVSAPVTVQTTCKATPVVSWSNPADIVYGTPLSGTQLNATANVPGSFVYTPSAGTVLNAGPNQVLSVDFTPADTTNYNSVNGTTVRITVLRATPVVTWNNPAAITYGTLLGPAQLNATANVAGTFTYTPPAGTRLNAGNGQNLSVDFAPSDSANYNPVAGTSVQINVLRAPTTTTITTISPSPSVAGQSVTVSFKVDGIIGTPSGNVTVTDGVDSCSSSSIVSGACTISFDSIGLHRLRATYSGDANHLPSTSAEVPHSVRPFAASATLEGSASVCSGSSATLRVSLTGAAPWSITWSDGVIESTPTSIHLRTVSPSQTTTYTITRIADQNGVGTATGAATITPIVVTPPSIIEAPPAMIGKPLTLRATPGYASYQWFHNAAPINGATTASLTIASVTREDFGNYSVSGTRDGCSSSASAIVSIVVAGLPTEYDAVIPVVGNTPGVGGSLFRTTVHLTNGTDEPLQGEITFIDAALPNYPFSLAPHETRFIEDLLPATYRALTSANVRRIRGPLPVVVAHVFNDAAALGTSGLIERAIPVERTLGAGERAVLVTPVDPIATRMNVGFRSFADGFKVRVTRRSKSGALLGSFERVVAPSSLDQQPLTTLLGAKPGSSESLTFEVLDGRGVIYGSATDNGTNDPNMQIAAMIAESTRSGRFVLPVAGSTAGLFNSHFSTGLQLHNSSSTPFTAHLTFHSAGARGTDSDASAEFVVNPGATEALDDVVASIRQDIRGLGSLDLSTVATNLPVLLARVYSIASEGQTSLTTPLVAEEDFLHAGEAGVVAAPHAPNKQRFNIGVRTLSAGARITATVRNKSGVVVRVASLSFLPTYFDQMSAELLLGTAFAGDESVSFAIDEGNAVVYGVWTDNVTQDPALQYAVRPLTGE